MKKYILLTILAVSSTAVSAQHKLNPTGRMMIERFRVERDSILKAQKELLRPMDASEVEEPRVSVVVVLHEGVNSATIFEGLDVEILSELNGVLVVKCPITLAEKIAELKQVKSVGFGDKLRPTLDFARKSGKVSSVQDGFTYDEKEYSYDGSGVVVGMMDTGLDANHINFKDSEGNSRIQRLWHMNSNDGTSVEYDATTISNFSTDDANESHATHVAGILGGGYKGNGTFMKSATAGGNASEVTDEAVPYYGVSTGADLAFAVGDLYTTNIIQGVTNIIEYAESQGMPAVVNLSLGHNYGPHDGTDYYSAALSRLGERGIICMSAGNEGESNLSITKRITTSTGNNHFLRTFPYTNAYGQVNGYVDLWGEDADVISMRWTAYNPSRKTHTTIIETTAADQTLTTSGNAVFSQYFNGTIEMTSGVDPNNDRYNVFSVVSVTTKSTNTTHYLALEATTTTGKTLYLFGNGVEFSNLYKEDASTIIGFTKGSPSNSINDAACADNIISVASYNSRSSFGLFKGTYTYGETLEEISSFSSYGTAFDGTKLPLVAGPGSALISSMSRYYVNNASASQSMSAKVDEGTITHYWGPMQGTSMSCPFVTGTIGLWLQADPTLDFERVMEVINNTSTAMSGDRWGAGKINALEGVKYVLAHSDIGQIWADDEQRLIVTCVADGCYDVFMAGADEVVATLYDMQGRQVAMAKGSNGSVQVDATSVQNGIYILEARSVDLRLTRKITHN